MKKSLFEQMGGTYTLIGDYYLPDIELPAEDDDRPLGVWAQRRLNYIKRHRRALYSQLVMTGKGIIPFPCCHREKILVYELSRGRTSNKCPHCGEYAIFDFDNMTAVRATPARGATNIPKTKVHHH